jgi:hypothetical protein
MDGNGHMDLKTSIVFIYACTLLLGFAAPVQKPAPQLPRGERFLFVVDTSSSMKRLDAANRQALFDLIYYGLNGRMLSNDTFGLWFFDEKAYTGEFPMQVWHPNKNLELASQAATFLKGRRYRGETRLQPVVSNLLSVIRTVKNVNIVIISDGDTAFAGTSFDQAINTSYTVRARERRGEKKPFVTTLVARNGSIVGGSVKIAGEPIQLPERPPPVVLAKGDSSQSSASQTNAVRPAVKPKMILIQNKSTNLSPEAVSPITETAANGSTNTSPPGTVTGALSLSATAAPVQALGRSGVVETNSSTNVPANKVSPNALSTLSDSSSNIAPQPDLTQPGETAPREEISTASEKLQRNSPPVANAGIVEVLKPAPGPVSRLIPASSVLANPIPVAAREPGASTDLVAKSPALTAVAITPGPFLRPGAMVIIGSGLFIAAFGVVLLAVKRYRAVPQSSFISRSMDRQ